ncbi:MAG: dihydrolipoamide dehydrogenase [Bacteroidota bacterium]|nr:dihydrolipoamide dehydrogenase [Bacteroidota bacterium]
MNNFVFFILIEYENNFIEKIERMKMDTIQCDVAVIGSGPGGYVAAIRTAQLGLNTVCIERDKLGGVCLNWGCIPTKALLKSAEYVNFIKKSSDFGIEIKDYQIDFAKVISRSREVSERMSNGIGFLFKKYKVQTVKGTAVIKAKDEIEVRDKEGGSISKVSAKNIIIATGARPRMFPGIDVDRKKIITSTEAMIPKDVPKSIIIMGAGAIGVEFAYFYNAFGSEVTIIEMLDRILPIEDADISKELERHYKKSKIKILTSTKVLSAAAKDEGVEIKILNAKGKEDTLKAEIALNAIGIEANSGSIGLEGLGIELSRGFIKVDKFMKTNIEGIYAIGDIAGPPWLAHKASAEGILAAETIAGHKTQGINYGNIPGCTYCQPQVASVGLTEAKAKEAGYDVKVGKYPFTANGKAHGIGEAHGFVKLVFDAKFGELLGAHLIGPEVTEMISESVLARSLEATAQSIFRTIHPHPTLSEAVMEAAAQAYGETTNL